MRIDSITITDHRFELEPPFQASWDTQPRRWHNATVVRVSAEGLEGIGSGDSMAGFAGHENLFIGQDPLALERHARVLGNIDFHYGRPWPLDIALWDLAGKLLDQPVWKLVGGRSNRVRAYASSGTLRDPVGMALAATHYADAGFEAMKIRFHRDDWREDIEALETVRNRVGRRLTLMVDCNQGWRMPWDTAAPWTLKDAVAVARELERLEVYWMEEPLHRTDIDGMRKLREMVDIRIAGAEMTRDPGVLRDLITSGALDVIQPDAALVGGITGLRRIAALAEAHGVLFTPHTWTNGIGVAANAHLTAGFADAPWLEFPFDPPGWSLDRRDFMLARPFAADFNGWITLPDEPGFGLELDEDTLRTTRID